MNTTFKLFPHRHKWFSKYNYIPSPGGRVLNTVYQNTNVKSLIVIGAVSGIMTILSDSSPTPTTTILQGHGFLNQWFPFTVIVPPGDYYEIVGTPPNLQLEAELTVNGSPVVFSGDLGPAGANTRAMNTVYQNTASKAKLIVANIGSSTSGTIGLICDASPTPTTIIGDSVMSNGSTYQFPMVMMVPQGYYYQVTGSATVSNWNEYTLPFGATQSIDLVGSRSYDTPYSAGVKDMWITASGNVTGAGQVSSSGAGQPDPVGQTAWSTWLGLDAMSWALVQPNDVYVQTAVQTAGVDGTLTHWFEYVLG
jgi:hypothetical protein